MIRWCVILTLALCYSQQSINFNYESKYGEGISVESSGVDSSYKYFENVFDINYSYNNLYKIPLNNKAKKHLFVAEQYFEKDKLELGIDEAGRGCLIGPVCIGSVILGDIEWYQMNVLLSPSVFFTFSLT